MLAAWVLSIAAVMALSVSLADLHLRAAMPLDRGSPVEAPPIPQGPGASLDFLAILRTLLIVAAVLSLVAIVVNLFSKEGRRRLLPLAAVFVAILLVQTLLSLVPTPKRAAEQASPGVAEVPMPPSGTAITVAFETQPPPWLPWLLVAGGALLAVAGAAVVILVVLRRRPPAVRERLAASSRAAVEALGRGDDLRGVILRCYREMVVLVEKARGITRGTAVTPAEFAALLVGAGLPAQPVRDLTGVFQEVRYGNAAPSSETERHAVLSLTEIARFCGDSP